MASIGSHLMRLLVRGYRPLYLRGLLLDGRVEPSSRPSAPVTTPASASPPPPSLPVVELRQYVLHPGQRDNLIELFERELVEPQEAAGMTLIGQFRDLDDPDRFVWMRGFANMRARARALAAFYDGPVWRAHRDAANAAMVDSDNVLLLHPDLPLSLRPRLVTTVDGDASGLVAATICPLAPADHEAMRADFSARLRPLLERHGARVLGSFTSACVRNDFPRLPVREDASVFVWLAAFADAGAYTRHLMRLADDSAWCTAWASWLTRLEAAPHTLRLAPTPRSRLRGVDAQTKTSPVLQGATT